MEKVRIDFKAVGSQDLERISDFKTYATGTINYIESHIELSSAWDEFETVYAIWWTDFGQKESVIDSDGMTIVPAEMLNRAGTLKMNLCASIVEDGILKARNTTYPVDVLELTRAVI